MLHLDFSIQSSDERAKIVNDFFNNNPDYKPSQSELDTLSNYILYGKDADGTSVVDRKEVEIETKYKSYSKRKAESLDELLETPGFNENTIVTQYVYKHTKPDKIDRERDGNIPGMRDLWAAIDRVAYILDLCAGRIEPDPLQPPVKVEKYSQTDLYKLNHHLIDMRKQQYVLREAYGGPEHTYNPNVHKGAQLAQQQPEPIEWEKCWFYPLGLKVSQPDLRWDNPYEYGDKVSQWDIHQDPGSLKGFIVIDFTNVGHIYQLAKHYQDLSTNIGTKDNISEDILRTLDFYVDLAHLSEARRMIWDLKCAQWSNEQIREKVNGQFETSYNENYISTMFKQNICTDIAAAARLHYDKFLNRGNPFLWKICSCCGERKLRDLREFMKKSKSSDGFASKCKECEKKARQTRSKAAANRV